MISTGIVRRIDDLGRIVIPKEVRRRMHICEGDPLEIFMNGTVIALKKYNPNPNYHDRFQEIITYMTDDEFIPSEKIVCINRIFEAIENMIKDSETATEDKETSNPNTSR